MKPLSKTEPVRRRFRKPNSAQAGGTFLTIADLMSRWGLERRTTLIRLREAQIASYRFTDQIIRYRLDEVVRYEETLRS
jgi:hypothetical protein